MYYGQNAISKNLIVADRRQLLNGNAFILGVSGSGKSFSAKKEMVSLALSTQDDIIVIDPESEYRPLSKDWAARSSTSPPHLPTISTPWIWSRAMGTERTPWC